MKDKLLKLLERMKLTPKIYFIDEKNPMEFWAIIYGFDYAADTTWHYQIITAIKSKCKIPSPIVITQDVCFQYGFGLNEILDVAIEIVGKE